MRRLMMTALALVLVAWTAAPAAQPRDEVRNVRASLVDVLEGDTLLLGVQWTAPRRPKLGGEITGYMIQILRSDTPGSEAGTILGGNRVGADPPLRLERLVAHDCAVSPAYYRVRVRVEGDWPADAVPWGWSEDLVITCGGPPTEPPIVELDTLAVDTVAPTPEPEPQPAIDSLTIGALYLRDDQPHPAGTFVWGREGVPLFVGLDPATGEAVPRPGAVQLCAYTWAGGEIVGVGNDPLCQQTPPVAGHPVPLIYQAASSWPTTRTTTTVDPRAVAARRAP